MTEPTWIRNPQDPEDDHDWTVWFDPKIGNYRGMTFVHRGTIFLDLGEWQTPKENP
jgi:hypothetical protein